MPRPNIGIFGGTFDPPHIGHLVLASEAVQQLNLSRLLWVLAPEPPHKLEQPITSLPHRLEMLKRTIAENPSFEISRIEIDRPGPHYTVDMLRLLMGPSNAVCDILRVKDEGERGMIRMLVNMMILTFVAVIVFVVVIEAI